MGHLARMSYTLPMEFLTVDVKGIKVRWYLNCFCIGHWIVHCGFQHIVVNNVQSFSSVR